MGSNSFATGDNNDTEQGVSRGWKTWTSRKKAAGWPYLWLGRTGVELGSKKKSKPQKVFRELKLNFFDVCLTWTPHLHHIFAMSGPMKAEKIC